MSGSADGSRGRAGSASEKPTGAAPTERRARAILRVALVWAGDIVVALSLFAMLYVLLIGAAVFQ